MNKKLLLTSALVGSLAIAGSADAKTKIYGDLEQTYASSSRDLAANKETGDEAYGSEANIGMKASKDVDLGTLSYGIKFEGDGNNTFDADEHFLDIKMDAVTLTLARNSGGMVSLDSKVVPHVGDQNDTMGGRAGGSAFSSGYIDVAGGSYAGATIEVLGGKASAGYGFGAAGTDSGALAGGESSVHLAYLGKPLDGVSVQAGMSETGTATGTSKMTKYGIAYALDALKVGVDYQDFDDGLVAISSADNQALRYGASYNVSDDLSVGVVYSETQVGQADTTASSVANLPVDEEITTLTVGYNLGGLGVKLYVSDIENLAGVKGDDAQVLQFQTKQKF
jgi:hypothetical protein